MGLVIWLVAAASRERLYTVNDMGPFHLEIVYKKDTFLLSVDFRK